jgi:NAD(P)-dependent dehydrogenase (short-subunit alcohol dehydrogenase family)
LPDRRDIAVVVGANGGIGHAIATRLARDPRYYRVIALSRTLPRNWPSSDWILADILNEAQLAAAASTLGDIGSPTRIVVATGYLHAPGRSPEKSMRALSVDNLTTAFARNAAGPALVAKHLLALTPRDRPSLFAALSARVGSIGDNALGGWHSYRASKAALNMLIHTVAIEHHRTHPESICVALHPGTVDTALSAPFQSGVPPHKLFTTDQSAQALLSVMDNLTPNSTGGFFAWDGTSIPW